jgi:hypothetical protein
MTPTFKDENVAEVAALTGQASLFRPQFHSRHCKKQQKLEMVALPLPQDPHEARSIQAEFRHFRAEQ